MASIIIVKTLGLGVLAGLWLFFYFRERDWQLLLLGGLGFLAMVAQIAPLSSQSQNYIAGGYVALIISASGMLRALGYRPGRPLKLSQ